MAFTAPIWAVDANGNDTNNGGGFQGSSTTPPTNGKVTNGTTSAPLFSSATYNFQSSDIGHWVLIRSGTNWIPGWYKITGVTASVATLDAASNHSLAYVSGGGSAVGGIGYQVGCVTSSYVSGTASATWCIDYSQQSGVPGTTYTDIVIDGTTNTKATSAGHPFANEQVGNVISITSGAGFTVQRIVLLSVAAGVGTFDKSLGTLGSTGGHGGQGGQLATIGIAGSLMGSLNGGCVFIKGSNFNINSATVNIAGGCFSQTAGYCRLEGFDTLRGDMGAPPVFTATNTIATFTLIKQTSTTNACCRNITVDGTSYTSSRGFDVTGFEQSKLIAKNCTNSGLFLDNGGSNSRTLNCSATGCTTAGAGINANVGGCSLIGCSSYGNSVAGYLNVNGAIMWYCIAANNSGGTTDGFGNPGNADGIYFNCTSYGNGQHGFHGGTSPGMHINCVAEGNGGFGYTGTSNRVGTLNYCADFDNDLGGIDYTAFKYVFNQISYSASAFNNPGSNDLSLNATLGGGRSLRGTGMLGVFPNSMGSTGYVDIGAVQSPLAAAGSGEHALAFIGAEA